MTEHGGPRWKVFISHTAELRQYPAGKSHIDMVERAVSAAGHVIVNMADFPATDRPPAQVCIERVQECDVYVGILGARYGSPVRDCPELSYTELEYDTAVEAGIPRLMFVMDLDSDNLMLPPSAVIDHEYGARQAAFCARVTGVVPRFRNPDDLARLVERSLRKLETRRRIVEGLREQQQPAVQPLVRAAKFINRPPVTVPDTFQDRVVETGLIADWLANLGTRMITVIGRGGMGKTAMVCRLLTGREAGRTPDVTGDVATMSVGGIVYLSATGPHKVAYPHLVQDLCRLLPQEAATAIRALYQDPHNTPEQVMWALLEHLHSKEGPVIVLLDELESVMDTVNERLAEDALREALETVLRTAGHPLKVLVTTRVAPTSLFEVHPEAHQQLWLEEGLGPEDTRTVLQRLDPTGNLGLQQAADAVLNQLHEHTRGFPRALEALKGILAANHPKLTPQNLVERTRGLPKTWSHNSST